MTRRDPTKALQVGFLALLLISAVMVLWWMFDHARYAQSVEERFAVDGTTARAADGAAVLDAVRADFDVDNDRTWLLSESAGTAAGLLAGLPLPELQREARPLLRWGAAAAVLGLLVELPVVTEEVIQDRAKVAGDAKVAVYRLRRQLEGKNITIHMRRGTGWWLDEETRNALRGNTEATQEAA